MGWLKGVLSELWVAAKGVWRDTRQKSAMSPEERRAVRGRVEGVDVTRSPMARLEDGVRR